MRDGVGVGGATPLWPSGLPWRGRGLGRRQSLVVSCPCQLEKAVEQRRREDTKLREEGWCAQSAGRPPHPQCDRCFLSQPIRLRAFAPLLFIPTAESRFMARGRGCWFWRG